MWKTWALDLGLQIYVLARKLPVAQLDSLTTSRLEAIQLSINQNSEDDLAQVGEIVQKYELESEQSLKEENLGFWKSIGAPNFILTTIEKGYKLPFASFPLAVRLTIISPPDFMLINSGRIRKVDKQPLVFNPLSVSIQHCGKTRSING